MSNRSKALVAFVFILMFVVLVFEVTFKKQPVFSPMSAPDSPLQTPPTLYPNLLTSPSLELPYYSPGKPEIQIPDGWVIYWDKLPYCNPNHYDCDIPCPDNCTDVSAGGVLSVTDTILRLSPEVIPLELGRPSVVTFSAYVTIPISAIEMAVYHNMALVTVTGTARTGKLNITPHFSRFEWEKLDGWQSGKLDLFTLQITPIATGTLPFEVAYFIGTGAGGWTGGGWYPGIEPVRRVTQSVKIAESARCRSSDTGCYWGEPECSPIEKLDFPYRVMDGQTAQKCFSYLRMYRLYLGQRVSVTPGNWYRFSGYAHGWQCFNYDACLGGRLSDKPDLTNFRVGISPVGAYLPSDTSVIWSGKSQFFDEYGRLAIASSALTDTVTVWVELKPQILFAKTTDSYLDNFSLIQVKGWYFPLVLHNVHSW